MLCISRKHLESITIIDESTGREIKIKIRELHNTRVNIGFDAHPDFKIVRDENLVDFYEKRAEGKS